MGKPVGHTFRKDWFDTAFSLGTNTMAARAIMQLIF